MSVFAICAIGVITAFSAMLIRESRPDIALIIGIAGGVMILLGVTDRLVEAVDFFRDISDKAGVNGGVMKILFKIVGVGYIADFSAGLAEESGAKALGEKIIFGAKIVIFAVSVPLVKILFEVVTGLLQ